MLQRLLALDGLVAVQAGHAHLDVAAALELVDDGRGLAAMALGTLACGADEGGGRLLNLDLGRRLLITNAATISEPPITTAMKMGRKDMASRPWCDYLETILCEAALHELIEASRTNSRLAS